MSTIATRTSPLNRFIIAALGIAAVISISIERADAIEEGTSIIGSDESPTVLNVVPWQEKELSVNPWATPNTPSSPVLDKILEPLDRDELRREVQYFNLLHGTQTDK